jgi:hypothetical protein
MVDIVISTLVNTAASALARSAFNPEDGHD